MADLGGKVALVTGASRGLGKGIALGLGEAGATVYITGRSTTSGDPAALPGTVNDTAAEVGALGGSGVPVVCDHRVDSQVEALFGRIANEHGRLDILVNNAFASPEQRVLWSGQRFWEMPATLWDDLLDVGVRSAFIAARFAVPLMLRHGGLIINVSSHAAGSGKSSPKSDAIIAYSVGKAALHRLTSDMAAELSDSPVSVVSIWPPASRTEGVLAQREVFGDLTKWREPIFTGRVVAAFAAGDYQSRSGSALVIDDLAKELRVAALTTLTPTSTSASGAA